MHWEAGGIKFSHETGIKITLRIVQNSKSAKERQFCAPTHVRPPPQIIKPDHIPGEEECHLTAKHMAGVTGPIPLVARGNER